MCDTRNPQNNLIIFSYQKGRSSEHLHNHISSFRGIIQVDGYAVYDQLEYINGINIVSCWAHTRRYFEQALENDKERAEYVLKKIRKLYLIEQRARDENMNIESRKDLRKAESKTILDEIKDYLEKNVNSILPTSAIGKAFAYTLKRWDKLTKYVELGQVEIDNNLVENVIRPIALGRKNYLFAGSHESAQRAAMIYSLLGTCKINNLNPMEWLHDIFLRINDHPINQIEDLLPHNWIKTRSEI
ncbi:MAG: IS66 family transposase [Saprospiraceae bacterium]|nr:IS66 family transposase [Candidatus Vicinibacter affinis]